MINNKSVKQVYLCLGITDMRKSINGLSLLVSEQLADDPFNGCLFVFCNRSRDKLKMLYWEHNGFWLYYKRLEKGKFKWPKTTKESEQLSLDWRELQWLLEGLHCFQPQAHQTIDGLTNN